MKIAILGTGNVGQTLAEKCLANGHAVSIGTRDVKNTLSKTGEKTFSFWLEKNTGAQLKTFADAVQDADLIINALNGASTPEVFAALSKQSLENKIIVDLSNPLDFSKGFPPTLLPGLNNSNSLGEALQQLHPAAKVVKTLNTMWCGLMLAPQLIAQAPHVNFISGNDAAAKETVSTFLQSFGWSKEQLLDLGDITAARGAEGYLLLWTRIYGATKSGAFNVQLVK
jgi:predicted dinucleotide-binding enzyme